jgi:hypothetical protein
MKYLIGILGLVAILFSGCATTDICMLDTAPVLPYGKGKVAVESGFGYIVNSVVAKEDSSGKDISPVSEIIGLRQAVGIGNGKEIGTKIWTDLFTIGAKGYLKYVIKQDERVTISLVPSVTVCGVRRFSDLFQENQTLSGGAEIWLLRSRTFNVHDTFTVGARLSCNTVNHAWYSDDEDYDPPLAVIHGGVNANLKIKWWGVAFIPEIGLGLYPMYRGHVYPMPSFGLSLSAENKQKKI